MTSRSTAATRSAEPLRLARADRREDLLDAALDLVASGDVDGVSVDTVAERAGVSRSLVYKHFGNRTEILTGLYERESARLHRQLAAEVTAARSLEEKYRALCHGSLTAAKQRGQIFDGLRSAAGRNKQIRKVQRDRDRQTAAAYVRMTEHDIGVPPAVAEPVTALLLGAIAPMLNLWHARPTEAYAAELEEAFMCVVVGTLGELRRRMAPEQQQPPPDTDVSRWMSDRLQQASPDQLRHMLRTLMQQVAGTTPQG